MTDPVLDDAHQVARLYAVVPPQYYTITATDDGEPLRVGTVIWRNGNAYGAYSMFEGYVSDDGMVAHSTYGLMHYLHLLYGQRFEIKYKNADGWRSYESYDFNERGLRFHLPMQYWSNEL